MPEGHPPLSAKPAMQLAAATAALALAVAVGACGIGSGEGEEGHAQIEVTRDFGAGQIADITVEDPRGSDTVIRALDRELEIETRHGGGFVHAIEGLAGDVEDGRSLDWLFFVNGIESDRGAADVSLRPGDRVWWDYRDWSTAMRVPAVVGSWPAPFVGPEAEGETVEIGCATRRPACEQVVQRLESAGAEAEIVPIERASAPGERLRVLVGPWRDLRDDGGVAQIADGPQASGVFARFDESGALLALDEGGEVAWAQRAGLVAATAQGNDLPTWVVTGSGRDEVAAAVLAVDASALRRRYAVTIRSEAVEGLPAAEGESVELPEIPVEAPGG